ncbi:MAG: phosphate ABC transporter permease subunit PstC [Sporomusa sp.]
MTIDYIDKAAQWFCMIVAVLMVCLLLSLFVFIARESLPIWLTEGVVTIIAGSSWAPLATPPRVGILTMFLSTLWASFGAMAIAAPLGICCAVFLSEFAPLWASLVIRTTLRVLTGIPSVVYGFLGASIVIPWYEKIVGLSSGESLFCASLVLSIMVVPYIVAGTYTALQAIPDEYRETGYSLGVSPVHVTCRILLPIARRNMVSSISLAFGRAAGETMAVLMLAGNTLTLPSSWFSKGEPLSALIALEIGSADVGSPHYQGIFAAGLLLLLLTSVISFAINYTNIRRRLP